MINGKNQIFMFDKKYALRIGGNCRVLFDCGCLPQHKNILDSITEDSFC